MARTAPGSTRKRSECPPPPCPSVVRMPCSSPACSLPVPGGNPRTTHDLRQWGGLPAHRRGGRPVDRQPGRWGRGPTLWRVHSQPVPLGPPPGREFVLTVSCPDQRGIVHAVTGVALELAMTIVDSQQFADASSGEFHLRMHLAREGDPADVAEVEAAVAPLA